MNPGRGKKKAEASSDKVTRQVKKDSVRSEIRIVCVLCTEQLERKRNLRLFTLTFLSCSDPHPDELCPSFASTVHHDSAELEPFKFLR